MSSKKLLFSYGSKTVKITIDTNLATGTTFVLGVFGTYDVDWGDGARTAGHTSNPSHTYSANGIYEIEIFETVNRFFMAGTTAENRKMLTKVKEWGDNKFTNFNGAFQNCINLIELPTTAPDLSLCDSFQFAFETTKINQSLNSWNFSSITNMYNVLYLCENYDKNINLNTSNVTDLTGAFYGTKMQSITLDCTSVTTVSLLTFYEQPNLTDLILNNMATSFQINYVPTVTGVKINNLANSVKDLTGLTSASVQMTPAQKASCNNALWTNKNWTII